MTGREEEAAGRSQTDDLVICKGPLVQYEEAVPKNHGRQLKKQIPMYRI